MALWRRREENIQVIVKKCAPNDGLPQTTSFGVPIKLVHVTLPCFLPLLARPLVYDWVLYCFQVTVYIA
ncbi:hypothetical protein GHT06_022018 [Daphnia sinensis]|uniref:Uncharacterized protein n=1 Tax=Daphnia sinensis TaxID=1820382 RepID=A0AAD5KGH1_9CRUS|nr:hypothetical protein GHT06_022018 [Daphnia sinensis]